MSWIRGSAWGLMGVVGCASAPKPAVAPVPVAKSAVAPVPVAAPAAAPAAAAVPTPVTGGTVLVGDIVSPPSFAPKATLDAAKPQLLDCYNQARQSTPSLHGKVTLRINVNEAGAVLLVDAAPGGSANDPGLVSCLGDALRSLKFPKPGGSAVVSAPLVFRP